MPSCSVIGCSSSKRFYKKFGLSLHQFPSNPKCRSLWMEAIGKENIETSYKKLYLCSLHFDESSINKTLKIAKLRDGAVPLPYKKPSIMDSSFLLHPPSTPDAPLESENFVNEQPMMIDSYLSEQPSTSKATIQFQFKQPIISADNIQIKPDPSMSLTQSNPSLNYQIQEMKIKKLESTCRILRSKIKRLNESVRQKKNKIASMGNVIKDLQDKCQMTADQTIVLEQCAGPADFLKRQILKSKNEALPRKYSEEIRKFALTLHFYSPKAYDFIRQTYDTCLPHTRTICGWYQNINADPGFTNEAFDALKIKVAQSSHPVLVALIIDEMAIRKGLTWDPKTQKFLGRVDYGFNIDSDCVEEANQSFVILVNAINGRWKLPIGYFFVTSLTGEQKCGLVRTAISMCENVGVKIVSITCDGPSSNFSMFAHLGCDLIKNQNDPVVQVNGTKINCFLDPCHMIKLIRNTFGELKILYDGSGREINYKYIESLHKLQEKQGLHLANKLSTKHVFFEKQKMKVKLASQLLSSSVADAIHHCENNLKIDDFKNSEGTVNFINFINDIFDVLNSQSIRPPGWKKAICPDNIGLVTTLFECATDYINNLKLPSGELVVKSRRKTGFIGMIICMNSTLSLYNYLVQGAKILHYIPLYKVSQDHLELFFMSIRAKGGCNNNPNAMQFKAAYKKLLIRAEIREGGLGNCLPLEQINILNCSSKNPLKSINNLTQRNSFVEVEQITDDGDLFESCLDYFYRSSDEYTESVTEYISGFIIRKICRSLTCDKCMSLLFGDKITNSLISLKSRGGLVYASQDVIKIVSKSENLIKPYLNSKNKPEKYFLYVFKFLTEMYDCSKVLYYEGDNEHNTNHRLLLIKSVIKTYIDLRFLYYGRKTTDKISLRSHLNKVVLFRNE